MMKLVLDIFGTMGVLVALMLFWGSRVDKKHKSRRED